MLSSEVQVLVRYAECDPLGIVYHANYFIYFEMARTQQMKDAGFTYVQMTERGAFVVLSEIGAKFRAPARYDDALRIELWLTEMERVRLGFGYRILNEAEQLILDARTLHACTTASDRLKRLPSELVAQLRPYVAASPET